MSSELEWPDPGHPRHERIVEYLKRGLSVADSIFDRIYPAETARVSENHWTPVRVAMEAAKLLTDGSDRRVLDVGSGCGKFCVVASLTSPGTFVGAERRKQLVEVAKESAVRLRSPAKFTHEDAFDLDWGYFDAFYFFNPFYELLESSMRIDSSLEGKGQPEYAAHVSAAIERLAGLRARSRVVTYHGFGGAFPPSYELVKRVSAGSSFLNLWVKRT